MDSREVLDRAAGEPDVVARYADHADGIIDVFLPPPRGRPPHASTLLVLVHGGFWRQEWDRTNVRPLASTLTHHGFVVAAPEYRRVGGLGGWPETGLDVEAALAAIPGLIAAAAPGLVDPADPVVLAGHSAGGHLALWAGPRAGAARVRRIVALAPVADLAYAARTGMGDDAAQALLGGSPDDVPRQYADADVTRMLPCDVPITIIQGTEDKQVTVDMNRRLAAAHPALTYVELDGVDHFALIDPLSSAFTSTVLPALST